jgi:hypothetical protein
LRVSVRLWQPCGIAINGGIAMPEPWDQKRIAGLTEAMLELLDAADLEDDAADEVCEILLSKLWQRSGLDVFAFRAAVSAALLSPSDRATVSPRRH